MWSAKQKHSLAPNAKTKWLNTIIVLNAECQFLPNVFTVIKKKLLIYTSFVTANSNC